jgi:general L-amino acid transport system substrate-binding protein
MGVAGAAMMGSGVAHAVGPSDLHDVYDRILERGYIRVGIRNEENWATEYRQVDLDAEGTAKPGAQASGGFDYELAMGLAAAVFGEINPSVNGPGESGRITFVPINATERHTALKADITDVNFRTITFRPDRDGGEWDVEFSPIYYYDGAQIWTRPDYSGAWPDGARIVAQDFAVSDLRAWMEANYPGMDWDVVSVPGTTAQGEAFDAGTYTDPNTNMTYVVNAAYNDRTQLLGSVETAHVVVEELVAKEPLAATYAHFDAIWGDIVDWYIWALFHLDEYPQEGAVPADTASLDAQGPNLNLPLNWASSVYEYCKERIKVGPRGSPAEFGGYKALWHRELTQKGWIQLPPNTNHTEGGLFYTPKVPPPAV